MPGIEDLIAGAGAMPVQDPRLAALLQGGRAPGAGAPMDPRIQAIMDMMKQGPAPMGQPPMAEGTETPPADDEAMLETVSNSMGKRSKADIPKGDLKWQDINEDRAILKANPTPENIASFKEYWEEDPGIEAKETSEEGED